jgi:hypothetical protein
VTPEHSQPEHPVEPAALPRERSTPWNDEPPLVTPELEGPDLAACLVLAVVWSLLGVVSLTPADRQQALMWVAPLGGGIALAVGTTGIFFWWRRRHVPALARECLAWAMLGVALLVGYGVGSIAPDPGPGAPGAAFLSALAGHLVLIAGALLACGFSFLPGWRVTPLVAWGRFGALAAVGFAIWDGLARGYWQQLWT